MPKITGSGRSDNFLIGKNDVAEVIVGRGGDDRLTDSTFQRTAPDGAQDTLLGGSGNDSLNSRGGRDLLKGGSGDDFLFARQGGKLIGGSGNDKLVLQGADSNKQTVLNGGDGFDTAVFSVDVSENQIIDVTASNVLTLANGMRVKDVERFEITTGSGDDVITLADNEGIVSGLAGLDGDFANGGAGNDIIYGLGGRDELFGGGGNDTLDGGAGRDRLHSDGGDVVTGGAGNDIFVFKTDFDAAREADVITDFNVSEGDALQLTPVFDNPEIDFSVSDPFKEGFARLTDTADGVLIEVRDRAFSNSQFTDLVVLEGVTANEFTDSFFG